MGFSGMLGETRVDTIKDCVTSNFAQVLLRSPAYLRGGMEKKQTTLA